MQYTLFLAIVGNSMITMGTLNENKKKNCFSHFIEIGMVNMAKAHQKSLNEINLFIMLCHLD